VAAGRPSRPYGVPSPSIVLDADGIPSSLDDR
jgi:hypothetical protein